MKIRFMARVLLVVLAAFGLLANASHAQSTNAAVGGQITDEQGRVVPGATVVLTNLNTAVTYEAKTNRDGFYNAPNLPPGIYRANVTKDGFKNIVKGDIELHVQDVASINFQLQIGSVNETVTVEAGASMINTTDASVSTVVDQTYIKNMPLNGRSFQDLILLTPGAQTQTPQVSVSLAGGPSGLGQTGEFSVNGQRTESNYYTVDGVSANVGAAVGQNMTQGGGASGSIGASTALGTTQALVSVDDLQEFRVQSSTYSAESGRNPGGQFAFETKSGTNQWHGTAYDYLRNDVFDANNWFNGFCSAGPSCPFPKAKERQNDFGGTFGGPVKIPALYNGKDKTFFFVSYEGLRLTAPQPATTSVVPDLCMRGAAADCPSYRAPGASVLEPVLNAFPVPNGSEVLVSCNPATDPTCPSSGQKQDGLARYIASWSNPSSLDSTSVRFDHIVSDKLRLFFRFSDTASNSSTRGGGVFSLNNTYSYTMRTYTAGASSIFTNRLSNDFRLNYSSNVTVFGQTIDAFGGNTPVNLQQVVGLGTGSSPDVVLVFPGNRVDLIEQQQSGSQKQWNFVDAVGLTLGHHQFKFGMDYRRLTPDASPPNPHVVFAYFSEAKVTTNSASTLSQALAPIHPLYQNFSAFGEDEWRVSQRLSLSVGLRWEVNPAPGVTQGIKPYTVQGAGPDTWTLASQGTPLWRTTWYNFAPRLGAAYILRNAPGWETVVRGGGGVFFDTGQQLGSQGFVGPPFATSTGLRPGGAFPAFPSPPPIVNPPPANFGFAYGFAPHLQLPYTLQWNGAIEQALGKSQALTVTYVGSHGSRLLKQDQITPTNNPNASFFGFVSNGLTSDYDSLQVQFRRKLGRGLTALASYTWSHCIDSGSENFNLGYQRGNCDFDVRHNLSAAFSYDLPNLRQNAFLNAVLRHWGVDNRFTARSAFPVTLAGNGLLQPNGDFYDEGLSFVPGQSVYLYGGNCATVLQGLGDLAPGQGCPGGRAINPNAFMNVSSGFGDAPRNFARGFGAWQLDMAIRRDFPIAERLKLQFRAEAFNIFNHPNFGTVDPHFGSTTFGQATATLASSLGVLNPLYQMGGPRSMQFALKIVF